MSRCKNCPRDVEAFAEQRSDLAGWCSWCQTAILGWNVNRLDRLARFFFRVAVVCGVISVLSLCVGLAVR